MRNILIFLFILFTFSCNDGATDNAEKYLERAKYTYSEVECQTWDSNDNGYVTCTAWNVSKNGKDLGQVTLECPSMGSCNNTCRETTIINR